MSVKRKYPRLGTEVLVRVRSSFYLLFVMTTGIGGPEAMEESLSSNWFLWGGIVDRVTSIFQAEGNGAWLFKKVRSTRGRIPCRDAEVRLWEWSSPAPKNAR